MQQKFLQQQLDKDLRQLQKETEKSERELKKDQLVSSSAAIGRIQDLNTIMRNSLKFTKRLVSFMVFDQDVQGKQPNIEDMENNLPPKSSLSSHE